MNLIIYLMFGNLVLTSAYYLASRNSFDAERKYSLISSVKNILSCSRNCRNDENCKGFVYNETNKECGLDNGQNATSEETVGIVFQVQERAKKLCGQYQKLLSIDGNGNIISGTFDCLKSNIESGAKLRIVLTKSNNATHTFGIKTAFSNDKVVCAQSQVHLTVNSYTSSYMLCTTGRVERVKIPQNPANTLQVLNITDCIKIDWFLLNKACQQVILTDKSKPNLAGNMPHNMLSMVVLQKHDTFVEMNYLTYTDLSKERIELIHACDIATYFTGEDILFDKNSSFVSSTFTFSKRIEKLMCPVRDNRSCIINNDTVEQAVYFNGNWEKVFTKQVSHATNAGAFETLRNLVLKGQKTMVHFGGKLMEPDIVFADQNEITAIFATYPIKSNSGQAYIFWDLVSTSGRYESIIFDYLTGNILNVTVGECYSSWYIDKAIWTALNGTEAETKELVATAVKFGHPIRVKSNCLNSTDNSAPVSCLYDGTIVVVKHKPQKQIARSYLYPYPKIDSTGLHLNISDNPLWMRLESHSFQVVNRRLVTCRNPFYSSEDVKILSDIIWFANYDSYI